MENNRRTCRDARSFNIPMEYLDGGSEKPECIRFLIGKNSPHEAAWPSHIICNQLWTMWHVVGKRCFVAKIGLRSGCLPVYIEWFNRQPTVLRRGTFYFIVIELINNCHRRRCERKSHMQFSQLCRYSLQLPRSPNLCCFIIIKLCVVVVAATALSLMP